MHAAPAALPASPAGPLPLQHLVAALTPPLFSLPLPWCSKSILSQCKGPNPSPGPGPNPTAECVNGMTAALKGPCQSSLQSCCSAVQRLGEE